MSVRSTINLLFRYAGYWLTATNRHGLQAPFLYALNEAVWKRDSSDSTQKPIEAYRRTLLKSNEIIQIKDYGAGFSGQLFFERSVGYITQRSAKPPRYARMLFRLVKHLRLNSVLELGTSVGISSLYMSAAGAKVITVEGCPGTAELARKGFTQFPEYSVELINKEFSDAINELIKENRVVDMLFVDGHHRFESTLRYIDACFPLLSKNAVVIIDDINWSDEMRDAWRTIQKDHRFTLSVDLFMLGVLFRSKDFSKEHFVVRY